MNKAIQQTTFFSKNRVGDVILFVFFISSLILAYWAVHLYRITIIETRYFVLPVIISSVLMTLLLLNIKTSYSKYWTIFQGVIGGICIASFILIFMNHRFREDDKTIAEFQILETGNLARGGKGNCSLPYARIEFQGINKELIFSCKYEKIIKNYSKVRLVYATGFFGFTVILDKSLQ